MRGPAYGEHSPSRLRLHQVSRRRVFSVRFTERKKEKKKEKQTESRVRGRVGEIIYFVRSFVLHHDSQFFVNISTRGFARTLEISERSDPLDRRFRMIRTTRTQSNKEGKPECRDDGGTRWLFNGRLARLSVAAADDFVIQLGKLDHKVSPEDAAPATRLLCNCAPRMQ